MTRKRNRKCFGHQRLRIDNSGIPFHSPEYSIIYLQPCVLTSVAEMEGTFNCFTTLLPQSIMEMFQRKSPRPRKYQESLETCVIQRRISMAHCENKRGSPLAHNSVQAWSRKCFSQCKALTRGAFLDKFLCFHQNGRICWGLYYLPPNETVFICGGKFEIRNDSLRHRQKLPWRNFMSVSKYWM